MEKVGLVILIILVMVTPLALMFGLGAIVEKLFLGGGEPQGGFNLPELGKRAVNYFIPGEVERVLQQKFAYYQKLSSKDKERFAWRVKQFIGKKKFTGKGGLTVTNEMSILIAASAIQLTFGLEKFLFDHFEHIYVYPKQYYNRLTKKYHKGEVNLQGLLIFSWEDFKEGYEINNDNYNLGLHEMAHALRFDKMRNEEYDQFFAMYIDKWILASLGEFNRIKKGNASFLRKYAGTNINEFFSVCVEFFFESPAEMKEKLPEIYKQMCILLNQDPLQVFDSAKQVRASFFKPPADAGPLIEEFEKEKKDHIITVFLGLLLGGMLFLAMGKIVFVSLGIYAGIFLLVFLFKSHKKIFLHREAFIIHHKSIFGETQEVYFFPTIITASFYRSGGKDPQDIMSLCYMENGKLKYATSTALTDFALSDRLKLMEVLKERDILVRHEGQVYRGQKGG